MARRRYRIKAVVRERGRGDGTGPLGTVPAPGSQGASPSPSGGPSSEDHPFLIGLLHVKPERYDVHVVFSTIEDLRADEINVYSNHHSKEVLLVPLPRRRRSRELNWHVRDGRGTKLVLMSQAETAEQYRTLFQGVVPLLREVRVPDSLEPFLGPDWERQLLDETRLRDLAREDRIFRINALQGVRLLAEQLDRLPLAQARQLSMLADYLRSELEGDYTPWVYLAQPLEPLVEPRKVPDKCIIHYCVEGPVRVRFSTWLSYVFLGAARFRVRLPIRVDCSDHLRLQLPDGASFGLAMLRPPKFQFVRCTRDRAHGVMSRREAERRYRKDNSEKWSVPVAQQAGVRMLAALTLLAAAISPFVAGQLEREAVLKAAGIAVPFAGWLLAYAWSRPWVRPFALTQLVFAYLIVVAWLRVASNEATDITPWAGLTGLDNLLAPLVFLAAGAGVLLALYLLAGALATSVWGPGATWRTTTRERDGMAKRASAWLAETKTELQEFDEITGLKSTSPSPLMADLELRIARLRDETLRTVAAGRLGAPGPFK